MDHLPPGADAYDVKSIEVALQAAFKSADDYVVRHTPYGNEGSCAVSVTVHCDQDGKASLISANLGDSRCLRFVRGFQSRGGGVTMVGDCEFGARRSTVASLPSRCVLEQGLCVFCCCRCDV